MSVSVSVYLVQNYVGGIRHWSFSVFGIGRFSVSILVIVCILYFLCFVNPLVNPHHVMAVHGINKLEK